MVTCDSLTSDLHFVCLPSFTQLNRKKPSRLPHSCSCKVVVLHTLVFAAAFLRKRTAVDFSTVRLTVGESHLNFRPSKVFEIVSVPVPSTRAVSKRNVGFWKTFKKVNWRRSKLHRKVAAPCTSMLVSCCTYKMLCVVVSPGNGGEFMRQLARLICGIWIPAQSEFIKPGL